MILTIPIGKNYSEYLSTDEHNYHPHQHSKNFDVITDDWIDCKPDESGMEFRKLKFSSIRHTCYQFDYMGHPASLKMNVLNGVIHYVELIIKNTDIDTFDMLNAHLINSLGHFVRREVSDSTGDLFDEPGMLSDYVATAYHITKLYYRNGDNVFWLSKSGMPNDPAPFITLSASTKLGYYSQDDFENTYREYSDKLSRDWDDFSSNFSIDGL